jgi:hypothetical protein
LSPAALQSVAALQAVAPSLVVPLLVAPLLVALSLVALSLVALLREEQSPAERLRALPQECSDSPLRRALLE